MAQKIQTLFIDDLDGTQAEGTVRFALDGAHYEIDLNTVHAKELRTTLARYTEAGRRSPAPPGDQPGTPARPPRTGSAPRRYATGPKRTTLTSKNAAGSRRRDRPVPGRHRKVVQEAPQHLRQSVLGRTPACRTCRNPKAPDMERRGSGVRGCRPPKLSRPDLPQAAAPPPPGGTNDPGVLFLYLLPASQD